jgi:alpha-amylase
MAMVIHFHQPADNLDRVVRRATERCYLPFLKTVAAHPKVPWTLHYSGCLLRWLEQNASEVTDRLRQLVASGQVELLTGGMEEPILASIPETDRLAQIGRLSQLLRSNYGTEPRGLWLTERVWEPELARTLARAGIEYTVIDDTNLLAVGIQADQLGGSWTTEYNGDAVRLVPASQKLRYLVPYAAPERVVAEVERGSPGGLAVYADDGEKFGEWPRTHRQVYQRRWLDRFLCALELADGEGRVHPIQLRQARERPPLGTVHLPSCAYEEMMTWALTTPARRTVEAARARLRSSDPLGVMHFLRGAPWEGFLSKYPEVGRLHRAMVRVSREVELAGSPNEAVEELHRAQCNCAYWHGTFGGAYLSFLRLGLWHHLVRAERIARVGVSRRPEASPEVADFGGRGLDEVRLEAPWGYAIVAPSRGGQVVELISWEGEANLIAVMGRHQEAYHFPSVEPAPVDSELELLPLAAPTVPADQHLEFDEVEVGALRDCLGGTWMDRPYEYRLDKDGVEMWWEDDRVLLRKLIRVGPLGLVAAYSVEAKGAIWRGELAVEVRSCPVAPGRTADSVRVSRTAAGWAVEQPGATAKLAVSSLPEAETKSERLVALGATMNGLEPMVQGISLVGTWPLEAQPGAPWTAKLELRPEPAPSVRP